VLRERVLEQQEPRRRAAEQALYGSGFVSGAAGISALAGSVTAGGSAWTGSAGGNCSSLGDSTIGAGVLAAVEVALTACGGSGVGSGCFGAAWTRGVLGAVEVTACVFGLTTKPTQAHRIPNTAVDTVQISWLLEFESEKNTPTVQQIE
jgi:hypothetical protein